MSRVLLVCPEPLGHGQPAGIGIRFVEIARTLLADGHTVAVLSPDGGSIDGCERASTTPESLREISDRSDVAVVQGHVINDYIAHAAPIPTVIDLYDPFIVENLHYYAERGAEVFTHDHLTLMSSVARGDLFLCASEAQRLFYLGVLLAAGRLNPVSFAADPHLDSLLRIAPFGVQPPRQATRRDLGQPRILFGGIYDWYNPILAIDAVALVREELPHATLTFTTHPNPDLTPQGRTAEAIAHVRRKGFDFVRFLPWVPYDLRGEFFDDHALALLTFPQSIETDLSMRTRVYDYLWGALPIVTSPAPGTDELLEHYHAGVIVRDDRPEPIAAAVIGAVRDAAAYDELVSGTRRFVLEHQWPDTLEPLRAFCREPRVDGDKDAFLARVNVPERTASIIDRLRRRIGGRV